MKLRMRHTVPVVLVAVALGASSTLLVASTGSAGGGKDTKPPREAISDCKPAPARCGSEDNDLVIAAATEAARRMIELETTGTTTVTNPVP
jgi:hypothetical protein